MAANDEKKARMNTLIKGMMAHDETAALLHEALRGCGHVLFRKIEQMDLPAPDPVRLAQARTAVLLDCETTGFDNTVDRIIQLSMMKVRYDTSGVLAIGETFNRLRDPGMPIPEKISKFLGITDEMVRGQTISDQEVSEFIADADWIACHNAKFDRGFCEAAFPAAGLKSKVWHCTWNQIDWLSRGTAGNLVSILMKDGLVYDAHDAMSDVRAMAFLLSREDRMKEMLDTAAPGYRLIPAQDAAFEAKDRLKKNGYSFDGDGTQNGGFRKTWSIVVPDTPDALAKQADFLRTEIYGKDVVLDTIRIRPEDAYSGRVSGARIPFRTAECRTPAQFLDQEVRDVSQTPSFDF